MRAVRGILMLGLSAAAGLAAVTLVSQPRTQAAVSAPEMPTVVIASQDLPMGQPVEVGMLKKVPWPVGDVPTGAFSEVEELDGRVVVHSLLRGEPVLSSKLAPVGSKGGLSALISEGSRAITVKVNEVVGVAGFALPGNFVDVLVATEDQRKKPISKIVLERILVLAIAQQSRAGYDENAPKVVDAVTLEVTPDQAERLDLARSVGALSLVLRNQVDQVQAATSGARKVDLFGATAKPVVKKRVKRRRAPVVATVRAQGPVVEVIRGTARADKTL